MYRVWTYLRQASGHKDEAGSLPLERFLASQLLFCLLVLTAFPVWLFVGGHLTLAMMVALGGVFASLAAVILLKATKSVVTYFVVGGSAFAVPLGVLASLSGEAGLLLMVWFFLVPFEAFLFGERRVKFSAIGLSVAVFGLVFFSSVSGWTVQPQFDLSISAGFALGPLLFTMYLAAVILHDKKRSREKEGAFELENDRLRFLAENVSELITKHDSHGKVLFASSSALSLLGTAAEDLVGEGLFERVHLRDRPAFLKMLSQASQERECVSGEFRVRRQIHSQRLGLPGLQHDFAWMEMTCRPLHDAMQNVAGLVMISRDVSERKSKDQALKNAHEVLQKNSNMKSQFMANMSHELRTPLNAIIGFSELLEQDLAGKLNNDQQYEYVRLIHQSGSHLLQVVTDVLDMSKIESGTFDIIPEPFDVNHLIHTCADILRQQAMARAVQLKVIVPPNLPEAVADSRACRQILINLISNSIKFSHADSCITIGVRVEGDSLVYFVRDTGIGMTENDLERIGQPFFQADGSMERKYEGTGLGVSVVKGLVELHKGSLSYESQLGKGTTATVRIPINCDMDEGKIEVLEPQPGKSKSGVDETQNEPLKRASA